MKNTIYLIFTFLIVIISSCRVFYENPQPLNTKILKTIPSELTGTYIDEDSHDTLVVTGDSYNFKEHSQSPEESRQNKGDLKSAETVLKMLDGNYILSRKITVAKENFPDNMWMAYLVKYQDNVLIVSYLGSNDKENDKMVASIKEIVPVKALKDNDETDYLINPTKKQFKTLIENNLFTEAYRFKKIR
jgi:hypothetical protein